MTDEEDKLGLTRVGIGLGLGITGVGSTGLGPGFVVETAV